MPLNPLHLRAFHEVAVDGSFTAAARRLHVSQPTLSEQVRSLERAHGVELFSRRGRSIALTPLGQELLDVTRRVVDAEDEAERVLRSAAGLDVGHLRLGSDSPVHAMPVLARFTERHPGMTVSLVTGNRARVLDALVGHRVDLAVVSDVTDDERLAAATLVSDRLVAVVPADHPLAGRRRLDARALAAHRLVLRESGSATRRLVDAALADAGAVPAETLEVDTREALFAAVASGLGVAAAASSEVPADERLAAVPLTPARRLDIALASLVARRTSRLHRAVFACV